MTSPPPASPQPGPEAVDMQDVIEAYKDQLAEAHQRIAMLRGIVNNRDRTIAELRGAVPHN